MGFITEIEYPLIPKIYFADVVWKIHPSHPPLITFEVETRDAPGLFKNTLKYFGTSSKIVPKPLYHYLIVLGGKVSEGNKAALYNILEQHNVALFEDLLGNPYEIVRIQKELEQYWTYTGLRGDVWQKTQEISLDKKEQKVALQHLIKRMFGSSSENVTELANVLTDSVVYHSNLGYYRENFQQTIHLGLVQADHKFEEPQVIQDKYLLGSFGFQYDLVNISGKKLPYTLKFHAESFAFKDIPSTKSVWIQDLTVETVKKIDGKTRKSYDLLSKIRRDHPHMLRPVVVNNTTVMVGLNWLLSAELADLVKVLTVNVNADEKLRVIEKWTSYVRKQDSFRNALSLITKDLVIRVEIPQNLNVAFDFRCTKNVTIEQQIYSYKSRTTHLCCCHGFFLPGEGVDVSWSSR